MSVEGLDGARVGKGLEVTLGAGSPRLVTVLASCSGRVEEERYM